MAEITTVKVPKPVQMRLAAVAKQKHMTQPALIEEMVAKFEDDLFWASFGDLDGEKYRAAMEVDGDLPSQDYSIEEQQIRDMEAEGDR